LRTDAAVLPEALPLRDLRRSLRSEARPRRQALYPVVGVDGRLVGTVRRPRLVRLAASADGDAKTLADVVEKPAAVAHPDEPLRVVAYRMAETGLTRLPVVDGGGRLQGLVSLPDLLRARAFHLDAERRRERVLALPALGPLRSRGREASGS
jgi:CBS domain-containing protein